MGKNKFDEWISEMLDSGDELIAKVTGKKLSEFTKDEKNTWQNICAEIGPFEDDKRISEETKARYEYWFSGDWYEDDPAYDYVFDEWISEMLDSGDELIAKVTGKKLSEFTKDEKNAWLHICAEIGGFEDDERMSKETKARYEYWFSGDWYEDDPAYDMQVNADIERSFKEIQEVEEWEKENKNRIVKVRYGDLIRISKILRMEGYHMEDDQHSLFECANELINLPETLKKPEVTH